MGLKILCHSHLFPNKKEIALAPFMKTFCDSISKFVNLIVVAPIPEKEKLPKKIVSKNQIIYHPKYKNKLYDFPTNHIKSRKLLKEYFNTIFSIAKREKPDLIHSHFLYPDGFIGAQLKEALDIPLIITLHGSENFDRKKSNPLWKEMDFALKKADRIFCPHPEMIDLCLKHGIDERKLVEIPLPINTKQFNPRINPKSFLKKHNIASNNINIIFVGRFVKIKDPITLIKSIPFLVKENKNIHFIFVGDDDPSLKPLKESMKLLIKKKGVERNVTFTGFIGDVNQALAASDIFVSLNTYDNIWTISPLEAMSSAVPCIITRVGYTGEYLRHNKDVLI